MESAKDVGKNVNKAREALDFLDKFTKSHNSSLNEYIHQEQIIPLQELVDRDEAKPVLHENVMKQFGKCPVCNTSVAIQFHSDFCGKCGNRLIWRGEGK